MLRPMRPPAKIVAWMDREELEFWVHNAPTKEIYRRRLAIWWTARGDHATDVANRLQTSARTVRYWIREFNAGGPTALNAENHGGRRWAHLSEAQERAVLARLRPRARTGRLVTITEMRAAVEACVGHAVSDGYLYDLLHRHEWRKIVPRPRHVRADPEAQEAYKKISLRSWNA